MNITLSLIHPVQNKFHTSKNVPSSFLLQDKKTLNVAALTLFSSYKVKISFNTVYCTNNLQRKRTNNHLVLKLINKLNFTLIQTAFILYVHRKVMLSRHTVLNVLAGHCTLDYWNFDLKFS